MLSKLFRLRTYTTVIALLAAVYCFLIAEPLYVSDAVFGVRGRGPGNDVTSTVLTGIVGASSISETAAVVEYIRSFDMLHSLDERHHLRELYSGGGVDPQTRLWPWSGDDAFLQLYRGMVEVVLRREDAIITVHVRSFDADSARAIAQSILELTEAFVNNMSARIRTETVSDAERAVNDARESVKDLRLKLTSFRDLSGELDPRATGASKLEAIAVLQQQAAELRTELAAKLLVSRETTPEIKGLKARLTSVENEIEAAKATLTGGERENLAATLESYEALVIDREYAEQRLIAATTLLDRARALAQERDRFVIRIVTPRLPDEATEPYRVINFFTIMLVALTAYGIVALAVAGIRDHRGI
jgi:capsular polysaccharide transport system permease protein